VCRQLQSIPVQAPVRLTAANRAEARERERERARLSNSGGGYIRSYYKYPLHRTKRSRMKYRIKKKATRKI
jgi:hypothetical protein